MKTISYGLNTLVMNHSNQHIRLAILILMIFFFACSTGKEAEVSEKSDKDSEMVTQGSYMYIVVAELSGTDEEMDRVTKDAIIMFSKIPGVLDMSVGIQDAENKRYNWGATVRFKDKAARVVYSSNPDHQAFHDQYIGMVVEIATVEYEVDPSP